MDKLTPEFWLQLVVAASVGVGVYSGIKSDLKVMHERIKNTNRRIDDLKGRRFTDTITEDD